MMKVSKKESGGRREMTWRTIDEVRKDGDGKTVDVVAKPWKERWWLGLSFIHSVCVDSDVESPRLPDRGQFQICASQETIQARQEKLSNSISWKDHSGGRVEIHPSSRAFIEIAVRYRP